MNDLEKKTMKEIGKRLKTWRQEKDLSTVEIQYRTGIARSTISGIEKGESSLH